MINPLYFFYVLLLSYRYFPPLAQTPSPAPPLLTSSQAFAIHSGHKTVEENREMGNSKTVDTKWRLVPASKWHSHLPSNKTFFPKYLSQDGWCHERGACGEKNIDMTLCGKLWLLTSIEKIVNFFFFFCFGLIFLHRQRSKTPGCERETLVEVFFLFSAPFVRGISPYKSCPHLLCHDFLLFCHCIFYFLHNILYKHVHIVFIFFSQSASFVVLFPPLLSCLSRVGAHGKVYLTLKCIQNAGVEQWQKVRMLLTVCVFKF